jgi:hypothetical protein
MPDVDLDDLAARSAIYYTPEHFLQGVIARAIAHAREIQRPVRIDDPNGAALYLDPRSGLAYQARSANALRALAQLPTRGTVSLHRVETHDAPALENLAGRPSRPSNGTSPCGPPAAACPSAPTWTTRCACWPGPTSPAWRCPRSDAHRRPVVEGRHQPARHRAPARRAPALRVRLLQRLPGPGARGTAQHAGAVARHNALAVGTAEAAAPPMRGLFKRILGKLLGARVGEAAAG